MSNLLSGIERIDHTSLRDTRQGSQTDSTTVCVGLLQQPGALRGRERARPAQF